MNRNTLLAIIGVLVVALAVVSYQLYSERRKTNSVEIQFNEKGISIQKE